MGVFLLSDFMLIPLVILTIRCSAGVFGFLSLGNRFLHYGHDTDGHVHFTSIRIHFTTIRAFIKYTDTDALKYVRTPGSHRGAEGDGDGSASSLPSSLRLEDTVHARAGVPQCTRRAVAGFDVLAPSGDASARPPPSFLCRVSFKGVNPHSSGHATTHSGTVPMNGREQTQELHWKGHPTTRSGTVPKNGREQTQELHLSKVPLTLPYFLTSTSETSCWRSYGGRYGYEPTLT